MKPTYPQASAHTNRLCHGAAAIAFSLALGTASHAAVTASPDGSTSASIPTAEASQDELAKKLANPIAAMISIPFQHNFDWGAGPNGDGFQWKMNVQPVIPFSISEDWNLITRTIVPVVVQDDVVGTSSQGGLSDTTFSAWLSPKAPTSNGWILGLGPAFLLPTGTDDLLTANQWAAGPTAIALKQEGKFTYGALTNQLWSFAGSGGRATVNQTFIQPFFVYLPGGGWSYALNTESTYDWTASQWTIPINLMVSKMITIGKVPTQWQLGGRWYAEKPNNGPDWGLRFGVTIILPKS